MKPLGKPEFKNPVVQRAAARVQSGKASIEELKDIRRTLRGDDAHIIDWLIESIKVLEGLP